MILPRDTSGLVRRYTCSTDIYGNRYCSSWDSWVRWLVLSLIVLAFFLVFMGCSCVTARRRRRQGLRPYYGTGWAAGQGPVNYYPQQPGPNAQPHYGQPAPPYSPPQQGYYAQGYFTPQQTGVELQNQHPTSPPQAPPHSYQPPRTDPYDNVYAPPSGPPPGK